MDVSLHLHPSLDSLQPFNPAWIHCQCVSYNLHKDSRCWRRKCTSGSLVEPRQSGHLLKWTFIHCELLLFLYLCQLLHCHHYCILSLPKCHSVASSPSVINWACSWPTWHHPSNILFLSCRIQLNVKLAGPSQPLFRGTFFLCQTWGPDFSAKSPKVAKKKSAQSGYTVRAP